MIGELSEKNLGIKEDELQRLKETVSIVYHSAATIKFNTHLRTAITINLIGTYRTIEFAKSLKKLDSYVYLSTAFCNSDQQSYIEEKVYTSVQDPYEMMKLAEDEKLWLRNSETEINALVGNHPNTYTFTKQLAENLLLKEFAGYPAGIVRPSVGKFSFNATTTFQHFNFFSFRSNSSVWNIQRSTSRMGWERQQWSFRSSSWFR